MRFVIDERARRYLEQRGGVATIFFPELRAGCCIPYVTPEVRLGPPDSAGGFRRWEEHGLTVHYPGEIEAHQDRLVLQLRGFGPFAHLGLSGWRTFGAATRRQVEL